MCRQISAPCEDHIHELVVLWIMSVGTTAIVKSLFFDLLSARSTSPPPAHGSQMAKCARQMMMTTSQRLAMTTMTDQRRTATRALSLNARCRASTSAQLPVTWAVLHKRMSSKWGAVAFDFLQHWNVVMCDDHGSRSEIFLAIFCIQQSNKGIHRMIRYCSAHFVSHKSRRNMRKASARIHAT